MCIAIWKLSVKGGDTLAKITYKDIKKSEEVNAYLERGNETLGVLGFTDHSAIHTKKVAETAGRILEKLGYDEHTVELAKIAGYMHDIGNCINRNDHAHSGALLSRQILSDMGMDFKDIALIMNAIGMHDEHTGGAVDPISAALILADKADVRRSRVRNQDKATFDIHDRVNYSVTKSWLEISEDRTEIKLDLTVDTEYSSIMDYFEIFLQRMLMCRRAASVLGMTFKLSANGNKIC